MPVPNDPRCRQCGRPTIKWSPPRGERSITDVAGVELRVCPEHGQAWDAPPADETPAQVPR